MATSWQMTWDSFPVNFSLSENFLFMQKNSLKNTTSGPQDSPFWRDLEAKQKFLAFVSIIYSAGSLQSL